MPTGAVAGAGPTLLGNFFNWGLYGVLSVQVYIYYMAFPNDRIAMKSLVYGIYLLETVQTIIVTRDAFIEYAIEFGNVEILERIQLAWLAIPVLSGIVSCTVQMFFAYRISILSGSKFAGLVIAAIAVTQGTSAIVEGVQAAILGDFTLLPSKAFAACAVWLAGSATCDVIIAVTMSYFLSRADTGFKATRVLINKLMRLTIETGTLTATIAIVDLVLFVVFPNSPYHITPALTLAKLYSNTLLVIFNSRVRIVGGRNTTEATELMEIRPTSDITSSRTNAPTFNSSQLRRLDKQDTTPFQISGQIKSQSNMSDLNKMKPDEFP